MPIQTQATQPHPGFAGIKAIHMFNPSEAKKNYRVNRDSLNITNSLIISNSQILFQDMGNGKIVPMQFVKNGGLEHRRTGSIQTGGAQVNSRPVSSSKSRQQKRKTA